MKLIAERADLLTALGHAQSAVDPKAVIPILGHIRLDAEGDTLTATATNLDILANASTTARIETTGSTTTGARRLYDIVRQMPDGCQIELTKKDDENVLFCKSGRSRYKLSTLPVEDFPDFSSAEPSHTFDITADDLAIMFGRIQHAIATGIDRPYLCGIYLHQIDVEGEPRLRATATDGHRLAYHTMRLPDGARGMPGIIVDAVTCAEAIKLAQAAGHMITIALSESRIAFAGPDRRLEAKLVDGKYPDYECAIPEGGEIIAEMDGDLIRNAIQRLSLLTTKERRRMTLDLADEQVTIRTGNGADGSSGIEEVAIELDGKPTAFHCNSLYLRQTLDQITGSAVTMQILDPARPIIFRAASQPDTLYLVCTVN